jgi:hypothetical protein
MAVTTCRECGKDVSTEALTCPHCGAPQAALKAGWGFLGYKRPWGFEWKSQRTYLGYPLVHIAVGRDDQGKFRVAKGVIAIGQFAVGAVTIAQFGVGLLFGFGQFILGLTALAQFAGAALVGVGQFASGYVAVGQLVLGYYGLAQVGLAKFLWSPRCSDPQAVAFFQQLWESARQLLKF